MGVRSTPRGGFGNRVLSYLSVRHLARLVEADYFFENSTDRRLIAGIHRPPRLPRWLAPEQSFRASETGAPSFVDDIASMVSRGINAVFKGPLLGEVLVRFADCDSREFATLSVTQCYEHTAALGDKKLVTAHLRAGDFRDWEPKAILPAEYYITALESLDTLGPGTSQVRVCVDDPSHPALSDLQDFLAAKGLSQPAVKCPDPFQCDLAAMAESDVLVSSPSTYALVAGMLGAPRVIHSRDWIENRVSRGEEFWRRIGEGTFPGYSLEKLV